MPNANDHSDRKGSLGYEKELWEAADLLRGNMDPSEARPEQCHRRLIADWATARGVEVVHLLDEWRTRRHELPEFARVEDGRVVYDVAVEGEQRRLF